MFYINKNYELYENIFIDMVGIMIGLLLILIGYYIYKKYINDNTNNTNNTNNNSKNK